MVDVLLAHKTSRHGCCPNGTYRKSSYGCCPVDIFKIKEMGSPDIVVVMKGFALKGDKGYKE